ncbi:hypothetical protein AAFF_G00286080 [Aldrovandia affinis]|uniref:Uncharacterized protein n=1 Tax=Aldrovandia affinis TaxID=143900 RepID=A0AAD7TC01_9TELE|nr:hypothetical protein AAFF_G00286080 [Aldrovandia affinis]
MRPAVPRIPLPSVLVASSILGFTPSLFQPQRLTDKLITGLGSPQSPMEILTASGGLDLGAGLQAPIGPDDEKGTRLDSTNICSSYISKYAVQCITSEGGNRNTDHLLIIFG